MKNKFNLGVLNILVLTIIANGCGGDSREIDNGKNNEVKQAQLKPNAINKTVIDDFRNQSTRSIREDRGSTRAKLSVTKVPHSDEIALMLETNRRDIVRTEFFIDLDANTATGVQVNRVTDYLDAGMAKNGSVGAELIIVNGTMYYYNLNRRHWRYWYHNWQLLDRVRFTRDKKSGRFIVKVPRNFERFRNIRANRKPVQIPGSVNQHRGDLDFYRVLNRMSGHIRVTVAMGTEKGNTIYLTRNVNFNID